MGGVKSVQRVGIIVGRNWKKRILSSSIDGNCRGKEWKEVDKVAMMTFKTRREYHGHLD